MLLSTLNETFMSDSQRSNSAPPAPQDQPNRDSAEAPRVIIEFQGVSHQTIAQVWERLKAGEVPEGPTFTLARSLLDHQHWYAFYETVGIFGLGASDYPGDIDPFLHVNLHFLIGLQILQASPPGAQDFYRARAERGDDPHEIIHMMLEVFQRHLAWTAMHAGPEGQLDLEAYETTLSVLEELERDELWERLDYPSPPPLHPEAELGFSV